MLDCGVGTGGHVRWVRHRYHPFRAQSHTAPVLSHLRHNHLVPTAGHIITETLRLHPPPDRFDPDRWENTAPDHQTYLPFDAGPQRCIGGQFVRHHRPGPQASPRPAAHDHTPTATDSSSNSPGARTAMRASHTSSRGVPVW
ncbi:cytochrome P450 [Streptomyces sp. NPDC046942]|uniref:cytochrome P450 n=1 Tax=Streptomyces sp. NPDC046942 TaxID=3155137 RepID=UPI0033D53C9D